MPRKNRAFPIPKLNRRGNTYRIRWYANKKLYEFSLGEIDQEHAFAINSALAAAFAERADIPDEVALQPAIKRYYADCNNVDPDIPERELIEEYFLHLKVKCKSSWPNSVRSHLKKALEFMGTLANARPGDIIAFLDHINLANSPATRNRAMAGLSGFYKWMRITGHIPRSRDPLEHISLVKEERPHDGIVIWEENEIPWLIAAADTRKDGIAIWIAIYAGLRRSEIAALEWNDVTDAFIIVGRSKTGTKRQVPLAKALARRLEKQHQASKKIVPWPSKFYGWDIAATRLIKTHLPNRLPELYEKHPEKFGWNPLRHTFASRHAQAGIPIDIIAAWLGDSPRVCKEHYARYVPANMRDTRIDLVDSSNG